MFKLLWILFFAHVNKDVVLIKPKSVVRIYLFEISSGEYICITT